MSSLAISVVVFAIILAGAFVGMFLRKIVPDHHFEKDSKDVVKLGLGLVGTMAALVLGLLTASAKSDFDAQHTLLIQMSANITLVDRALAHYGPETGAIRRNLHEFVDNTIHQFWPDDRKQGVDLVPHASAERLYDEVQALSPTNDAQRALQSAALKSMFDIAQSRWTLVAQSGNSVQFPLLVVMVFWFATLFVGFCLLGQPNLTVIITLTIAAMSIAGAIYLILEMDRPFDGLIQMPSDSLRNILPALGK